MVYTGALQNVHQYPRYSSAPGGQCLQMTDQYITVAIMLLWKSNKLDSLLKKILGGGGGGGGG